MIRIYPSALPAQTFYVVLDGQYCTMSLYQKSERLYMDLAVGASDVFKGAICLNGADIVQSPSTSFSGSLHFFDRRGNSPPHWSGLADRFMLIYVGNDEELPAAFKF